MNRYMKEEMQYIIRNGYDTQDEHGRIKANIISRTFVLYIQDKHDLKICADYLGNRCYRGILGGQMEQVLEDTVCISYVNTPADLIAICSELRRMGVRGRIGVDVEYADGMYAGTIQPAIAEPLEDLAEMPEEETSHVAAPMAEPVKFHWMSDYCGILVCSLFDVLKEIVWAMRNREEMSEFSMAKFATSWKFSQDGW